MSSDVMENRIGKTVVTAPTVEFLLKQVYVAHKEKVKGLESEVQQLKAELHEQRNRCDDCRRCKILSEELRKCKDNYLERLSDQKYRIELLEMQLLSMQQAPVSKSRLPSLFKTTEESLQDVIICEPASKKQKKSEAAVFQHSEKVEKENCLLFTKTVKSENLESLNIQPLSSIIVPETLDVDINDDADITVIGIYGKQTKEEKNIEGAIATVVPESIDVDLLETIKPKTDHHTSLTNGEKGVTPKHFNEYTKDLDRCNDMNSPSLLSHIGSLHGKYEQNIEKNKETSNSEQKTSKITSSLKHLGDKSKNDMFHVSSVAGANVVVKRDVTSQSLICPPKYKIKQNDSGIFLFSDHKADSALCSEPSFGEKAFLCESEEDMLEDMDETFFQYPLTSHHTVQKNGKCENGCDEIDDREVEELDDAPNEMPITEEKCVSKDEHSSGKFDNSMSLIIDMNNPVVGCSFDEVPKKDTGIKYKFKEEPVRKKEERLRLLGHQCKQCEEYYNHLNIPESERAERITTCSRHRAVHIPPTTPEYYWELDIPDTAECKARGYVNETQKIQLHSRRRHPLVLKKDK